MLSTPHGQSGMQAVIPTHLKTRLMARLAAGGIKYRTWLIEQIENYLMEQADETEHTNPARTR